MYNSNPQKRTYYGNAIDIELAKQSGLQGNFIDISNKSDDDKYKEILNAYRTGANPVILGGVQAKGGINESTYERLKRAGVNDITRIAGNDRNQTQQNLRNYIHQLNRNRTFEFNYDDAKKQAAQQLNPLYQQALERIRSEKYQNTLNAGELASKRGLSKSGLAADLQNKIAIAAQSQIAQTEAEKAAKIAELAQSLRDQSFREFIAQKQMDMDNERFDYSKERDTIADKQRQEALEWEKSKFRSEQDWRKYVYNNMSAAEKAEFELRKQQFGEEMAWRMYELKYNGELAKSQAQAELDFYKNFTVDEKGGGSNYSNYYKSKQASKSPTFKTFQSHMSQAVKMGVPASWVPALTELIGRESSWNPKAKNPKSTAHGYGQFLNSTRATYEKKTGLDYDNPVHQIVMMAQYVKDRYGTPEQALAFWDRNKWY
jgi:Transglycosylase SLT domain